MFNIKKMIKGSNLSKTKVHQLQDEIKKDYPNDPLLYELHMIRALKSSVKKTIGHLRRKMVVSN